MKKQHSVSQPDPFPKIILSIFLAVSILMFAIAIIAAIITGRALARESSAPGHVVDLVLRRDQSGQELHHPVVEFYLPDESLKLIELTEGSWPPAYEKGQSVTVLYDPARPLNARIQSASSTFLQWLVSIITGVLGVIFLMVALLIGRAPGRLSESR